jgi:hypothetical protein
MEPTSRSRPKRRFLFTALTVAGIVASLVGCVSVESRKATELSSGTPTSALEANLSDAFGAMPPPRFRKLTYAYSGERSRTRTEFTLITNNTARAQLAFVNFLKHGINPGLISGYGELLPLLTVSSNTLPVIRTIQRISVIDVIHLQGRLFPLQVGNAMKLRVLRNWEQRDPSGALLDQVNSPVTLTFRVLSVRTDFEECSPKIFGEVFEIEQQIDDHARSTVRRLHFAMELGACVKVIETENGAILEEARLTGWEPLLYRQHRSNAYEN